MSDEDLFQIADWNFNESYKQASFVCILVKLSPNLAHYANSAKCKLKLNLQLDTIYFTWIKKFGDVLWKSSNIWETIENMTKRRLTLIQYLHIYIFNIYIFFIAASKLVYSVYLDVRIVSQIGLSHKFGCSVARDSPK